MSEPFLGEIKMVGFNFAPRGFAMCDGQILPISQNQALFSLLGTTYGGDGRTTFALPDLRGRAPGHAGDTLSLGERRGEEAVTLTVTQIPAHGHVSGTGDQATQRDAAGNTLAARGRRGTQSYASAGNPVVLAGAGVTGASQPHENMQPFLTLNFVIALQGIFPSRN